MDKVLYRYEIGYRNEDGPTEIILREYPIVKETEASYCIRPLWRDKWIRKTAYNAYAHTSKDKAKDHFVRRTHTRIRWFEYWMEECKKALELIEEY